MIFNLNFIVIFTILILNLFINVFKTISYELKIQIINLYLE